MPSAEPPAGIRERMPLAALTTLGVGGTARWFVRAERVADIVAADAWCRARGLPFVVLGGGSNLVVSDAGVDGLVVQMAIGGVSLEATGERTKVRAGAGERWDDVVASAVSLGLVGVECLSGIPGSVGGTPVQNVGAYGQEVAATIVAVTVLDRQSGETGLLNGADCGFGYRMSRFKAGDLGRFVVCEVTYEFHRGRPTVTYPDVTRYLDRQGIQSPGPAEVRDAVLSIRRDKGMLCDQADPDARSVGSFFMNPVVDAARHAAIMCPGGPAPGFSMPGGLVKVPAAWLIERAGFSKGHVAGAVGLSSKHVLAIVNRGGATARDVLTLARRVKQQVADRFGIWLLPEPTFVGFGDDADVAFLERARE